MALIPRCARRPVRWSTIGSEFFLDTQFRKSTGCFIFCCTLCSLFGSYWIAFPVKIRTAAFFWAVGTAVLGPVILPID